MTPVRLATRAALSLLLVVLVPACGPAPEASTDDGGGDDEPDPERQAMLTRADTLEMNTGYSPPPGEALHHHTAGFAKIMCSNVFISGLDPDFAAENVGFFSAPYEERQHVTDTVVDYETETVRLSLPDGVTRVARRYGSQGCVALPMDEDSVFFTPSEVEPNLPDPSTTPWPMGDVLSDEPFPAELDSATVAEAVDAAFQPPEGMTAAFVVTWRNRIIGERYREGIDMHTPLESWSMGKTLSGTLMGVLIQQGVYDLWQRAPVPEWQDPGDPRQNIRIGDIMRMSSGLRFRAPQDPDFDPEVGYPDHLYVYAGTDDSFQWAATRPMQWPPGTVGRYRNSDPVTTNYLTRLAVEGRGGDYHAFPQRHLFDKLGIRNMVMETDPYGNFLTQGYELGTGRDWARLANLYLQDGVWNGERILPEGWVEYAMEDAPAWIADGRPIYGGSFFWQNTEGSYPVPESAIYMAGAGGQTTLVIPSHDLAVVRLGHYRGSGPGREALTRALELLMEAVPESGNGME